MSTFLPYLYKEYQDLSNKLSKVSDLIAYYGGELPIDTSLKQQPAPVATPIKSVVTHQTPPVKLQPISDGAYPQKGSLKEKILFSLNHIGKPSTVKDIIQVVKDHEEIDDEFKLKRSIGQIACNLANIGYISADKTQFQSKYFLNP